MRAQQQKTLHTKKRLKPKDPKFKPSKMRRAEARKALQPQPAAESAEGA